jgi:hypothetical protein
VKRRVPETAGDPGPGSLSQSCISYYREIRLISRDDAPTQGWLTKDGALELFALSLNNNKGFSKKAIIFSEFQAFRINAPGLVDNSLTPDLGIKLSSAPETMRWRRMKREVVFHCCRYNFSRRIFLPN